MITRREFVVGVGCAAIAGKLVGQDAGALKNENLITSCGTYCGACPMYLATQENNARRMDSYMAAMMGNKPQRKAAPESAAASKQPPQENMRCDGCLAGGRLAAHCSKCAIRDCAATKSKTRVCSGCDEFPCSRITDFNNDGVLHHAIVIENLRQARTLGIKEWAKQEEDRWRCTKCQARFSWYDAECPECKTPRSDKLFALKKA